MDGIFELVIGQPKDIAVVARAQLGQATAAVVKGRLPKATMPVCGIRGSSPQDYGLGNLLGSRDAALEFGQRLKVRAGLFSILGRLLDGRRFHHGPRRLGRWEDSEPDEPEG